MSERDQLAPIPSADPVPNPEYFDPKRPIANELQLGTPAGFTMTAVGDCVVSRPMSAYQSDAGFGRVMDVIRRGDIRYGNLETVIFDIDRFRGYPYSWDGDWPLVSHPSVAEDLASLGFHTFSTANNHALDWGIEGMRETARWLDDAGLVHAGTGEHRGLARAARYRQTGKGRVGLVSFASSYRPTTDALPQMGAAPGRPGLSALGVHAVEIVPPAVFQALQSVPGERTPEIQRREQAGDEAPTIVRFGVTFEAGASRATRFDLDSVDVAEILRAIRQGKESSDFLIAAIHAHQSANGWDFGSQELLPADFLQPLARAAIDAGASAFVTTGNHNVGPVEIYKSKPILYGLGNFFWSDLQEPLSADLYQAPDTRALMAKAFAYPERATDADLTALLNAQGGFANEYTFEGLVAQCRFDPGPDASGRLTELRLYPVLLRYGDRLTRSGIPTVPDVGRADQVLKKVSDWSAPYRSRLVPATDDGWRYARVEFAGAQ